MELDDLKQAWQQQTPEDIDVRNDKNIIDMIQNKSYGPIASLQSIFKRTIWLIPIMIGVMIWVFMNKDTRNDFSMWALFIMIMPMFILYFYWYLRLRKLQKTELPVKATIENDIAKLKSALISMQLFVNIFATIFIVISLEFIKPKSSFVYWHSVPIYLRYFAYIGFAIWAYFSGKKTYYRNFGKHIDYMKDMLRKME